MYRLTEEGRKYLKEGLPERRLIELLKRGSASIEAAKKALGPGFGIALQWCKKHDCIELKGGNISLSSDKIPDDIAKQEEGLRLVQEGRAPEKATSSLLFHRRLIEEERETLAEKAEKIIEKEITYLLPEIIAGGAWKKKPLKKYDISVPGPKLQPGKRQPYSRFLSQVRRRLVELGFKEMVGPLIESEFWNFDALFQPQNHPARDWTDTYQLNFPKKGSLPDKKLVQKVKNAHEKGWKYKWIAEKAMRLMPRAHTTAVSARTLLHAEIPGKYFSIGRCFRPDVLDATHLIEFNQVEGIVLDENITFRNLLGLLKLFAQEFAGTDKVRFATGYFPFTEASCELLAHHPKLGWMELGGAGIFREEVTKPLGVNVPVIAWGIGMDRLAMLKLGVKDIRYLFSHDMEWLRDSRVIL
ncbi:MAG: phenylalanine--tRNA ligase subunit alpha [Candidatus Aenigmarchaeota archaeon]|nr:phenylalanine--tRNA ligase subunit alpha [Candidatus Aenigmarchaeota archaeon]